MQIFEEEWQIKWNPVGVLRNTDYYCYSDYNIYCRLGCNPIRDEGAEFLIDGIKNNKSLTKVWLV